jgi:hypothetical protein
MVPGANPITRLPPWPATTATTTIAKTKPPRPWHVSIKSTINSRVLLEGTALEAAGAAGKVVGPTVAIPVTRSHIWATKATTKGWHATSTSKIGTIVTTGTGLTATLAHVTPTEVEVLAWPTIPVSRLPVHFVDSGFVAPCLLIMNIEKEKKTSKKYNIAKSMWL